MINVERNKFLVLMGAALLLSACDAAQNYPHAQNKISAMQVQGGSCTESLSGPAGSSAGLIYLNIYDDEITGERKTMGRAAILDEPTEALNLYTAIGLTPRTKESRTMLGKLSFASVGGSIQLHLGTAPVSEDVRSGAGAVTKYSMSDTAETRRGSLDGILQRMSAVKSGPGENAYWSVSYMNMRYNTKPGHRASEKDVYVIDGQPKVPAISTSNASVITTAQVEEGSETDTDAETGEVAEEETSLENEVDEIGSSASLSNDAVLRSALFSSEGLNVVPTSLPPQPLRGEIQVDADSGMVTIPITPYDGGEGNSRIIVQFGNANSGWYANCYAQDPGVGREDGMSVQVPVSWQEGEKKVSLTSGPTTVMVIRSLVSTADVKNGVVIDAQRGRLLPITLP